MRYGNWELTVYVTVSGTSVGVGRSPGDFTQGADSWETGCGRVGTSFEPTHTWIQTLKALFYFKQEVISITQPLAGNTCGSLLAQ